MTIRLDNDILDWFRKQVDEAGGGNYQTVINDSLREYIARQREPLEPTIRRVIREELRMPANRTGGNGCGRISRLASSAQHTSRDSHRD